MARESGTKDREEVVIDDSNLTGIQKKMLTILRDGQPHTKEELGTCLYDDQAPLSAIAYHIVYIRQQISPQQYEVVCRGGNYRLVKLLSNFLPY